MADLVVREIEDLEAGANSGESGVAVQMSQLIAAQVQCKKLQQQRERERKREREILSEASSSNAHTSGQLAPTSSRMEDTNSLLYIVPLTPFSFNSAHIHTHTHRDRDRESLFKTHWREREGLTRIVVHAGQIKGFGVDIIPLSKTGLSRDRELATVIDILSFHTRSTVVVSCFMGMSPS